MFSLSRFTSPVRPGLLKRGKPGQTVTKRDTTVALPWQTRKNRGKPMSLHGGIKMINTTVANQGEP